MFIIVFDGLGSDILTKKSGRIDEELFPRFSALGEDSLVFTNAISNYFDSQVSIQSLLTGVWLEDGEFIESARADANTVGILSMLSNAGFSVESFSNANSLITCDERNFFICGKPSSSVAGNNTNQVVRDFWVRFIPRVIATTARDFWVRFIPRVIATTARDFSLRFLPGGVNTFLPFPSIHQ